MKSQDIIRKTICARLFRVLLALGFLVPALQSHASVSLLMEEPYGDLGHLDPAGHAAVYLNHICAATPTQLRPCEPGELGAVISRYHKIDKTDWIAMPLVPYLYAVEDAGSVPKLATKEEVTELRNAYWRAHLTMLAPPAKRWWCTVRRMDAARRFFIRPQDSRLSDRNDGSAGRTLHRPLQRSSQRRTLQCAVS